MTTSPLPSAAVPVRTLPRLAGKTAPASSTLTALELFAGAGGLAIGMHSAGFEIVDLVESSEACCETLRANAAHVGWKNASDLKARDIREVDLSLYEGRVSIISAGAPCQPFSHGARDRRGRHDDRNMLPEVINAIAQCRPRAFVIENVRGLLFPDSIDYFKSVVARLRNPTAEDPGTRGSEDLYHLRSSAPSERDAYRVDYRVLNAADFGLAQYRPRLFIVGVGQTEAPFEWPTGMYSRESLIEDLRGSDYWQTHPDLPKAVLARARERLPKVPLRRRGDRWRTLRDLTLALGPPAQRPDGADDPSHVLVRGARLYGKHTGSRVDWVAKTVKAGVHGSPGGEHILVSSPGRYRYLTVRECAELQGFPHDYVLPAKRTPAMRQLGNAVPVSVARALALKLKESLDDVR